MLIKQVTVLDCIQEINNRKIKVTLVLTTTTIDSVLIFWRAMWVNDKLNHSLHYLVSWRKKNQNNFMWSFVFAFCFQFWANFWKTLLLVQLFMCRSWRVYRTCSPSSISAGLQEDAAWVFQIAGQRHYRLTDSCCTCVSTLIFNKANNF